MEKAQAKDNLFERLSVLQDLNDEAFEEERRKIIEEEISKYPPEVQERLRRFQWTLDMKRKKCKNPLEACFMFHEMLMEQVYGENGLLENLERFLDVATGFTGSASVKKAESIHGKEKKESFITKVVSLTQFAEGKCRGRRRQRA